MLPRQFAVNGNSRASRRRTTDRRTPRARTSVQAPLVSKNQVRQMIKSAIDYEAEDKYSDSVLSASNIDYAGYTPFSISDMAQGSTDTSRVGDSIVVKLLTYSLWFTYNATNTTTNLAGSQNLIRFVIFAWKPFFGDVAPTAAKVFTYTSTAYSAQGPLTHDGIEQFTVLHDELFTLDGFSHSSRICKGTIKLNHVIHWKGGSTSNQSNGIYVALMSNASAAPFPVATSGIFRVDFQDA